MAAKTLGAKLDDELRTQVLNRCQTKGCRTSDYLKDLIKRDLASQSEPAKPAAEAAASPKTEGQAVKASLPQKANAYVPPYVAKYQCRACGQDQLHENQNYQGPPAGKCDACHEKFIRKTEGKCPFCAHGEVEPLGPEDIEEMGMYVRSLF